MIKFIIVIFADLTALTGKHSIDSYYTSFDGENWSRGELTGKGSTAMEGHGSGRFRGNRRVSMKLTAVHFPPIARRHTVTFSQSSFGSPSKFIDAQSLLALWLNSS